jgi:hypothetical protein
MCRPKLASVSRPPTRIQARNARIAPVGAQHHVLVVAQQHVLPARLFRPVVQVVQGLGRFRATVDDVAQQQDVQFFGVLAAARMLLDLAHQLAQQA